MIPIMTQPGNPYHNASCESFMKTLKQEEIYANEYRDLEHLSSRALRHSSNTITIDAVCTGRWAIVHPKSAVETVPSRPLETRHQTGIGWQELRRSQFCELECHRSVLLILIFSKRLARLRCLARCSIGRRVPAIRAD